MNRDTNTRIRTWLSNPSLIWLPFALPFFGGKWGVALGAVLFLFIIRKWHNVNHSWRPYLFVPLLVLLLSMWVGYLWFSSWMPEWGLLAVAISAGWLWRIEYVLSVESPLSIEEWLYSARLFGFGSLALLLLYIVLPLDIYWLPGVFILSGVLLHYIRIDRREGKDRFSCPLSSPLVRMAIVSGDQIWLTDRPFTGCYVEGAESNCHAPIYLDHPLTSCVNPNETPEEALTRAFLSTGLHCESSPRFLLKHQYESCPNSKRIIYLFVLNAHSKESIDFLQLRGHFYTPSQIDKRLQKGLFSPLFSDEYTYLKNTLLKVNTLNV